MNYLPLVRFIFFHCPCLIFSDEFLMPHSPRILVLAAAAAVIVGLCTWRTVNPHQTDMDSVTPKQPASAQLSAL